MSGVNAHAILQCASAACTEPGPVVDNTWQRSKRCHVEVLVSLHPLVGAAFKVWAAAQRTFIIFCFCQQGPIKDLAIIALFIAIETRQVILLTLANELQLPIAGQAALAVQPSYEPPFPGTLLGPSGSGGSNHARGSIL